MNSPSHNNENFQTTHWSMVLEAARDKDSPKANGDVRKALEDLCQTYWYPLYTFARRKGESPEAAMDATQSFFADLLENPGSTMPIRLEAASDPTCLPSFAGF